MGSDFAEEEVGLRINVKEAVTLENSLELFCDHNRDVIKIKTIVVNIVVWNK